MNTQVSRLCILCQATWGMNLGSLPCSAQKVSLCESQPFSHPQGSYVVSSFSMLKPNFASGSSLNIQSGYDTLAFYRLLTNYVGNLHKVWRKRFQSVYHCIEETILCILLDLNEVQQHFNFICNLKQRNKVDQVS